MFNIKQIILKKLVGSTAFFRIIQKFSLVLFLLLANNTANATFHKNLWPLWEVHNPLATTTISHDDWQTFLDKHLVTNEEGINLVDYPNLKEADYDLLKSYIEKMAKTDIGAYNRNEQLAFWLNLYNALTIQVVADYYPIDSIEEINISPGLFSIGPWGAKLITINQQPLSLDEIQNRIIRPIWNDPRTLYVINNAAIGAANLQKHAYHGVTIEKELNEAASDYINSLRGVQVLEGKLIVSKIYDWFNEDFGGTKRDVITHIKLFANEPLLSQLKHTNTINSYTFNWHLNSRVQDDR